MPIVLPRALHLTADKSTIVEEDDEEGAFVLGGPGTEVPDDEATRLGLAEYLAQSTEKGEKQQHAQPPKNKAMTEPPATKAVSSPQTPAEESGSLPDGFPGKDLLEGEGIKTMAVLGTHMETLEEVKGVGPVLAEKIRVAYEEATKQ